jgi:ABC-type phosphate transport system substrate-binding protein
MDLREEINKALGKLPKETLEGVLEYIQFVMEPPEVEPTEEEYRAIYRGREEFARGEYVRWEDIRGK